MPTLLRTIDDHDTGIRYARRPQLPRLMCLDTFYQVHHQSDVRFTESWIGTFFDYMRDRTNILDMDYDQMRAYCKELKFDQAGHEIHSPQVKAWSKRHKGGK